MSAADELRTAAAKLRDLATRTHTTLDRHELQWTDLTAWAGPGTVSPMVWSQYAAAMHPGVGLLLAEWLMEEAHELANDDFPGIHMRALKIARAINGNPT